MPPTGEPAAAAAAPNPNAVPGTELPTDPDLDLSQLPPGDQTAPDEGVIAEPGETGAEALERAARAKAAEEPAEGEPGEGGEGKEEDGKEPSREEVIAQLKAQNDALMRDMQQQKAFLDAQAQWIAQQDAARAQAERAAQAKIEAEQEAKLPPEQRYERRAMRLEQQLNQLRAEQDQERRISAARETINTKLSAVFKEKPYLEAWKDEILARVPLMGNVQDPIGEAARAIDAKLVADRKSVTEKLVKPREQMKGHQTLGKTGGATPPAIGGKKLDFKSRDDVTRYLAQAVPPSVLEDELRQARERKKGT